MAGGEAPDPVRHSERPRPARRRHLEGLLGAEPAGGIGRLHAARVHREPHRLEQVEGVGAGARIGSKPHREPPAPHRFDPRETDPEAHVARRIVGDGGAPVLETREVVVVHPDRMGGGEVRSEEPQVVEVGGEGLPELPAPGHRLHLRLRDVGVNAGSVLRGEVAAGGEERILAVVGDGRGESEPRRVAVEAPSREREPAALERRLAGRSGDPVHRPPEIARKRPEEARHGVPEAPIGHERRHHRPDAHLGVGPGDRLEPLRGRRGELREEVVAGGDAVLDHLRRREPGRQGLVT